MKAASEIITVVLILTITISLVATALTWALPLIEKTQHRASANRINDLFNQNNAASLPSAIHRIFSNGGEEAFTTRVDGLWILYPCANIYQSCSGSTAGNNSLEFNFFTKTTPIAPNQGWISLSSSTCPPIGPEKGLLGADSFAVVCARADNARDGYNVTYRVWYRELYDASGTQGQLINLVQVSNAATAVETIRLSRGNIYQASPVPGKTLTITEIKIIL